MKFHSLIDYKIFHVLLLSLFVLIIFPVSPPLLPLASFIRMSVGDEKCNHETRRRDAARGNMFAVDKHTCASCRAFLARFSIVLDKPICMRIRDYRFKPYEAVSR